MPKHQTVPEHLGLILDGNRRWAKAHGLPTLDGHKKGYDNLKDIAKAAFDHGVKYVTAYVFSIENWDRTPREVKYLMDFTQNALTRDIDELNKENVRILWLGIKDRLSQKLINSIENIEATTSQNTRGTLCVCFNYGGEQEIVDATKKLIDSGVSSNDVTKSMFEQALYKPEVPPIDLLIRTSGEQRISGFMLYRTAYSELYFVDKHWPDFSRQDLDTALQEFATRDRRFGE